jgi:hypothetical protein
MESGNEMNVNSADNFDKSLYCAYFGGPRDGFRTGDLPATFSGQRLTGFVSRVPMSQPAEFSLFAVYECTSQTQIGGFWQFHYQGLEGPAGENLVAAVPVKQAAQ